MQQIVIPIPTEVDVQVRERVRNRMAETYGGFTAHVAEGGWKAPDGQLITEKVDVITAVAEGGETVNTVAGESPEIAPEPFARATARHVARESDQTEVMWFVRPITACGFES